MNMNKLNRIMHWVELGGLMIAAFCWGWNLDTVNNS